MSKTINYILTAIATFLLCFCWLTYYRQSNWICYTTSILLAVLLLALLIVLDRHSQKHPRTKSAKKRLTDAQKQALTLMTDFKILDDAFLQQGCQVTPLTEDSRIVQKGQKVHVEYLFKLTNTSSQDVIDAFKRAKKLNADKFVVFCISFDASAKLICDSIPLPSTLMDFNSTITFLKQANVTLLAPPPTKTHKLLNSNFFFFAFNRRRFKYYFTSALFLLLLSQISFYSLYNIIVASLSLIFGLYSLVNKRFNPQTQTLSV